jgi:CHASE3 domain sensor protein
VFDRLTLRTRILLGYSIPVLLSTISAGAVFFSVQNVKDSLDSSELGQVIVKNSDLIALNITRIQRAARGYLIQKNPEVIDDFETSLSKLNQSKEVLKNIDTMIPEQRARLEGILKISQEVIDFNQELLELAQNGQEKEALDLYRSQFRQSLNAQIENALNEFNSEEDKLQDLKNENTVSNLEGLSILVLASTAIVLGLAFVSAWAIANRITETIKTTATTIASSSQEIASTIEQQERVLQEQATAVSETTTTMDELNASSHQSADRSETMRDRVEQISDRIVHLTEQVNQIEKIATLVSDLANQTNMLSLNAAVEAVRAGEHGKGFSVVATEIRKLADRSKQSAEKISELIVDIRNATNSAVVINEDGGRSVESIVSAVNYIAVNAQQISLSSQQQALATQQVVSAMNKLNQSAQETASGIAQTKIGIQQLNQAAIRLKEEV